MPKQETLNTLEEARQRLNSTPWWRFIKRQEAGDDFKFALLQAAFEEIDEECSRKIKDK